MAHEAGHMGSGRMPMIPPIPPLGTAQRGGWGSEGVRRGGRLQMALPTPPRQQWTSMCHLCSTWHHGHDWAMMIPGHLASTILRTAPLGPPVGSAHRGARWSAEVPNSC